MSHQWLRDGLTYMSHECPQEGQILVAWPSLVWPGFASPGLKWALTLPGLASPRLASGLA